MPFFVLLRQTLSKAHHSRPEGLQSTTLEVVHRHEAAVRLTLQYATKLLRLVVTGSEIRGFTPRYVTNDRKNDRTSD